MTHDYCSWFGDFNIVRPDDVRDGANCELVVGDQYLMRVDGSKTVRVLLLTPAELNENNEMRAHVVVLEENPYVKAGAECRPLAYTMHPLK